MIVFRLQRIGGHATMFSGLAETHGEHIRMNSQIDTNILSDILQRRWSREGFGLTRSV